MLVGVQFPFGPFGKDGGWEGRQVTNCRWCEEQLDYAKLGQLQITVFSCATIHLTFIFPYAIYNDTQNHTNHLMAVGTS